MELLCRYIHCQRTLLFCHCTSFDAFALFFGGSAAVLGMATSTIHHDSAEAICARTNSGMFASDFGSACCGHKQS